jgi:signal transduction histidine kinase
MESWQLGAMANLVIAVAYFLICWAILRPLVSAGQVRANKLGLATAMIFFSCGVHHGTHSVHLLAPTLGVDEQAGLALREAFTWHVTTWDVLSAGVGIYYWSLRKTYGPLMRGAALFEDMKERQRQALELNDDVVQGLAVARMALDLGQRDKAVDAIEQSMQSASRIISDLLGQADTETRLGAGDLVRDRPAQLRETT